MDQKIVLMSTSAAVILYGAYHYFRRKCAARSAQNLISKKISDAGKQWEDVWNTVLFFPDFFPENEDTTTRRLIWYLEQAERSIDVCMYTINFRMLRNALINKAIYDGVRVRILTNTRFCCKNEYPDLEARIKHHVFKSEFNDDFVDLLHHKFIIIDNRAAINGSLNWTMSGITENNENVAITTDERIVAKFRAEFARLWLETEFGIPQKTDVELLTRISG